MFQTVYIDVFFIPATSPQLMNWYWWNFTCCTIWPEDVHGGG